MVVDEFLEIAFVFTYRVLNHERNELQGHYSFALKNANDKCCLTIYQIQRELITRLDGLLQSSFPQDDIQLDLPITLKPMQACYMH